MQGLGQTVRSDLTAALLHGVTLTGQGQVALSRVPSARRNQ
jgi:hypothetical protein